MKWTRKQIIKGLLRKNWSPKVMCHTDGTRYFEFKVSMISVSDLHYVIYSLYNNDRVWWNIDELVSKATDEILSMIGYEFSKDTKRYIDETCESRRCADENIMLDASKVAGTENRALLNNIAEYEDKYDMSIRDWFIDYIMIRGNDYI